MKSVILKKKRDESVKRFHPWIFSGAIQSFSGQPREGEVVKVLSYEGETLGEGHWHNGSIAVRLLLFGDGRVDRDFFINRIEKALRLRSQMGVAGGKGITAWRLIHGEGDNLPGLVIDVYNDTFVIQAHSYGMYLSLEDISDALSRIFGNKLSAIYSKSSSTLTIKPEDTVEDRYIQGLSESPAIILENGKKFLVDWVNGQKTGFFLDQRENRALVEKYSKGRRVLNLFSYTGGFSVYALAGGALSVDSVDSSRTVGDIIAKNIELNKDSGIIPVASEHRFFCSDVNNFLKESEKEKYDLIIVDPPAYAKHRDSLPNALKGYQRLNASVIEKISRGGLVFTFSCSQAVDRNAFALAVFSAAAQAGRSVKIVGRMTQPADHPVNIFHPEGEYLKGLILYVE